jgi:hypothetical protein
VLAGVRMPRETGAAIPKKIAGSERRLDAPRDVTIRAFSMNLLFNAIVMDIQEIARSKGIKRFRVSHKRNGNGDLVVALIIEDKDGPLARVDTNDRPPPNRWR